MRGDCTLSWNHYPNKELGKLHDDPLRAELGLPEVSFVFQWVPVVLVCNETADVIAICRYISH